MVIDLLQIVEEDMACHRKINLFKLATCKINNTYVLLSVAAVETQKEARAASNEQLYGV